MDKIFDTIVNFKVDRELKKKAKKLFHDLGINVDVALNMFLIQSVKEQRLPFIPSMDVSNKIQIGDLENLENIV